MKNTDKQHKEEIFVRKDIARYELRINHQTHDIDNHLAKIEKQFLKSNARSVQIFEISPSGDKKIMKSKSHPATELAACGSSVLLDVYKDHGFKAWQAALNKATHKEPQAKAA